MPKRDISKPTYYLDSCVFIDLIENPETHEPAKTIAAIIAEAEEGGVNLVTSVLTVAEVLYAKHEIEKRSIDPAVEAKIQSLWHPASSPIQLVDVHELIVRDAVHLLRDNLKRGWSKTRGNDAIHLVTARREFVDEFFTTENAMNKWAEVLGYKVCAPHFDPPPADAVPPLFSPSVSPPTDSPSTGAK